MRPGAFRVAALGALLAAAGLAAAAPVPTARIDGADYVSLADAATALGMRDGSNLLSTAFTLTDRVHRVDFQAESPEIFVDGLRVFLGDPAVLHNGRPYVSRIDFERCLLPMLRPGMIAGPVPRAPRVIVIDPGHGGPDHGTENPRLGLMEKTFTLDTALRLKRLLESEGYRVILTRYSDPATKIELQIRALIANQAGADLFISIHFNSLAPDARTKGIEIFTFPPQHQRASGAGRGWRAKLRQVNRFDAWKERGPGAGRARPGEEAMKTDDRGKKLRHLGVLRDLNCPGILVEGGFLSSDSEARRIASPAYRDQLAAALAAGIRAYGGILDGLRPAPAKPQ